MTTDFSSSIDLLYGGQSPTIARIIALVGGVTNV
jgi:hypothetical protein